MTFKDKLLVEYPLPLIASVWGGDDLESAPLADIDKMIESCVDELASDIVITCYIASTGMLTQLPDDTITVSSAKFSQAFMGNRLVKVGFDASTKVATLRYYPATITYRRRFRMEDLLVLSGDQLRYTKAYILWKLATKELMILKSVDLKTDNSSVNLSYLESFATQSEKIYNELKPEILLYATQS